MKDEEQKKRRAKPGSTAEFKAGAVQGLGLNEVETAAEEARASWNASDSTQTSVDVRRGHPAASDAIEPGFYTIAVVFGPDDRPTDYRFVKGTPPFARQTGTGLSMEEIAPDPLDIYGRVSLVGKPARFELQSTALGRCWSVCAFRIDDRPRGQIGVLFDDITERKRREHHQAFLLKFGDALRPIADPEKVQAVAADLLGAHLRVNHSHYGEVRGECVFIAHSYADGLPPMTGSFRADEFGKRAMASYRAGELQVCVNTAVDPIFSEHERQALQGQHIGAYVAVPLVKAGEWVGTFGVQSAEPREWSPSEIELVQEVANRTWASVQFARAEKALRKSEEKYRTLFDSIDEGFTTLEVLFDEQGKAVDLITLEINPAYGRHSGVSRELLGKRLREVLPTVEDRIIERYGRVALTGEPVRFEQHVALWDYWFDAYATRVGGEGSHVVGVIFNNITERKRREQHAAFVDKLSETLTQLDSPEEIVRATGEALGALLGVSFVHLTDVELKPGDPPAEARITMLATWERQGLLVASGTYRAGDYLSEEFLRAARAGETVVIRDSDIDPRVDAEAYRAIGIRGVVAVPILKDGSWPSLIAIGTPEVRDWRPDEVSLIIEVAHRVFPRVERVRAAEALRASDLELKLQAERTRAWLFSQLMQAPVAVCVLTGPEPIFSLANPLYLEMAGRQEVVGKSLRAVYPELERDSPTFRLYEEVFSTGVPYVADEFAVAIDKGSGREDRYFKFTVQPMRDASGKVTDIMVVGVDVTPQVVDRLRIESLLEELKKADQRKDEFLATLAHELRNPLATISMALSLLQTSAAEPENGARHQATARRQVQTLVRMVDDLLDISRITRGTVELRKEKTNLAEIVRNAANVTRAAAEARGHRLEVTEGAGALLVNADATRIEQVLVNLITNAIKYTDKGGTLSIRVDREEGHDSAEAVLRVRDSGRGIPADMLDKVFDLFVQVTPSLDRSTGGLGVGLTLVKRMVELHGGTVRAHSEGPGRGSEFVVRLPLASDEQPGEEVSAPPLPVVAGSRRVVVVEDVEDLRNGYQEFLENLGHEVSVAANGRQGVAKILEVLPDVSFVDVGLPGIDGYEVARQVRASVGGARLYLVALTGYGGADVKARAEAAGFDLQLTKPVELRQLAELVSTSRA